MEVSLLNEDTTPIISSRDCNPPNFGRIHIANLMKSAKNSGLTGGFWILKIFVDSSNMFLKVLYQLKKFRKKKQYSSGFYLPHF